MPRPNGGLRCSFCLRSEGAADRLVASPNVANTACICAQCAAICSGILQGRGVGWGLLKDAMLRTLQAADIAGIGAFAVRPKDGHARAFYGRFILIPSPVDPYHLSILLKDVRVALQQNELHTQPKTVRSMVNTIRETAFGGHEPDNRNTSGFPRRPAA